MACSECGAAWLGTVGAAPPCLSRRGHDAAGHLRPPTPNVGGCTASVKISFSYTVRKSQAPRIVLRYTVCGVHVCNLLAIPTRVALVPPLRDGLRYFGIAAEGRGRLFIWHGAEAWVLGIAAEGRGRLFIWHGAARRRGSAPLPRRSRVGTGAGAHKGGGSAPTAPGPSAAADWSQTSEARRGTRDVRFEGPLQVCH